MKRSRQILVVAHCILNANAKITPLATNPGADMEFILPRLKEGTGILQLPCPETSFLGMRRWGMTVEQYDVPAYRDHCRKILHPALLEIQAYITAGYEIAGVAGVEGSPSCGTQTTCAGFSGGEIGCGNDLKAQQDNVKLIRGSGVFMNVFQQEAERLGFQLIFFDVGEKQP